MAPFVVPSISGNPDFGKMSPSEKDQTFRWQSHKGQRTLTFFDHLVSVGVGDGGALEDSSRPICRTVNAAATVGKTLAGCSASIQAACPKQTMRPNVTGECMTVMQVSQAVLSSAHFILNLCQVSFYFPAGIQKQDQGMYLQERRPGLHLLE